MSKASISLTTSGMKVGTNTRKRFMDLDHAQTIIEYTKRGYMVRAHCDDTPMWTVAFSMLTNKGTVFANVPLADDVRTIIVRPSHGTQDGRLEDDNPGWISDLINLVRSTGGESIHINS